MGFARRLLPVLLACALGSFASAEDSPRAAASATVAPEDHAQALIEQIRCGAPAARDEAVHGLLELAETEDERPAPARPVHEVLRRALLDPDAEVRFRVRRVLADPEVRVERLLVSLLEPQPTDAVKATRKALVERADRAVARAGLIRIARKAAQAGFDPLTDKRNEQWHPWGLEGGAKLRQARRFHVAVDLLAETASDEEIAPLCELLQEDLGDSLNDVIDAVASRPGPARDWCRAALKDPRAVARENAAWTLGEIGTADDVPALDAALNDTDPRVRRAVVSAFELLPVADAACVQAAGHANDADPRVAAVGLHVGALHGQKFVTEAAQKLLAQTTLGELPLETRVEAARALGKLGDTSGVLRALAGLGLDVSKFAAWSVGSSGDVEGIGTFETLITREEEANEPAVYYGIARAGALTWLDRLTRAPRDDTRRLAIQALGSAKGDAEAIAEQLQQAAARAVEREGGADWNDFLTAFRALRDRGDEPSRKMLAQLLDQALLNQTRGNGVDDQTLGLLVEYVHQARATASVRALVTISRNNRSHYVRGLAMDALATLDPRRAREVLTPMLDSPQMGSEMRQVISRSLTRAGDHSRAEMAIEIAKQQVARSVNGQGQLHFSDTLNSEGIEHAYAAQLDEAVLCFRRMRWLQPDNNVASYNIACALALAGDKDDALRWLRRSIREGFKNWRHIKGDPDLTCLTEDTRFNRLIDELRLVQEVEPAIER